MCTFLTSTRNRLCKYTDYFKIVISDHNSFIEQHWRTGCGTWVIFSNGCSQPFQIISLFQIIIIIFHDNLLKLHQVCSHLIEQNILSRNHLRPEMQGHQLLQCVRHFTITKVFIYGLAPLLPPLRSVFPSMPTAPFPFFFLIYHTLGT